MPAFAIDPEIHVRHRTHPILRSIDEARDFARRMILEFPEAGWRRILRQLEKVRTEDDALEAAVALESHLERENMLAAADETPVAPTIPRETAREPRPEPGRAVSLLYATARAEPHR
jgi:hypothetical protein